MDILEQVNKVVESLKDNDDLRDRFMKDPVKTTEKLLGVNLPDDVMDKVVDGVKGKLVGDNVLDAVSKLKKLF